MTGLVNVAGHLARMARERPEAVSLHIPHGRGHQAITFRELNRLADALAHGLTKLGITRGTRTVLMVPPSRDFFALTFALFKVAAVPVLIDPGMGVRNLGPCLAKAEPEAFIGIPKAHVARRLLGWCRGTIRMTVNVGSRRFFCSAATSEWTRGNDPFESPSVSPDDLAAILFTSGSTGPAKGVEYTHGIFAAQVEMLKAIYGIHPGEIDFCTFPLFALFGPALGMTCVVPDMDASRPATIDAAKAIAHLKQFQVTNFFGSPAVIRALGRSPVRDVITTLRRVISAGAPANPADLEQFSRLILPTVDVFTPYGATESLPVANIGSREILSETRSLTEQGRGVCIGRPVAGMSVEIIRISDEAIPEWDESLLAAPGEVGEFVVRGAVVTKRYYGLPEATAKAKIRDARTGESLHRMGDVGYKDDRGRLWFCGRKSHRVVTPAGTLFTEMIEPMFNARIGRAGFRTALVGVSRGGVTWPVLCWQRPDEGDVNDIPSRLRDIAMSSEWTRAIGTFLMVPGPFPVDVRHNSKIFREKLAAWADRKLGRRWTGGPG